MSHAPLDLGLLTPKEAAACLKVARYSIYKAVSDGHLRAVRINGRILIREADLRSFVAAGGTR